MEGSREDGVTNTEVVSEDMQQKAVEVTSQAFEGNNLEKDIAMVIKKEFDRLYGTTWHCVVGKKWVLVYSISHAISNPHLSSCLVLPSGSTVYEV